LRCFRCLTALLRFPVVSVLLIVANRAVWLFYELPHLNAAVSHASFYPCSVEGACRAPEPWGLSWITAMFLHRGWDHILGTCCSWPSWRERRGRLRIAGLPGVLLRRRVRRAPAATAADDAPARRPTGLEGMFSETIRLPASRITAVGRVSQQVQQDEGDVQADLAATGEAGGRRRRCVPIFCEV
jgi:hypothetical protein